MGMISHGAANGTPPPSVFLGAANSVCWVDAVMLDCVLCSVRVIFSVAYT